MTEVPRLVIVTGPPAAGKTSIARAVADRLGLPLVAKDALKEILGGVLGTRGREESRRLGTATFELQFHLLRELLAAGCSAIAEGNFPARVGGFGTLPPARIVQVYVDAPPDILRMRMLARAGRHPVHYDAEAADEIAVRRAAGEWAPLPVDGALLRVDTASLQEPAAVAETVARMLT